MRKLYQEKLKRFFRRKVIAARLEHNLTQEEFSERLEISLRNYSEIERGKSACSALTLVLFLIYFCPDVKQFLNELKESYENEAEEKI